MDSALGDPDIPDKVLFSLRQIIRAVDLHSRRLVHDHGLTGPQLVVLRALERLGEVPVGTLAREVSLSHATVTGVVDRLERRSLVKRSRSSYDKRKVLVGVTVEGVDVLRKAPPLLQEQFIARFMKLEAWEQTLVLSSVQRIASMMQVESLGDAHALPGYIDPAGALAPLETMGPEEPAGGEPPNDGTPLPVEPPIAKDLAMGN